MKRKRIPRAKGRCVFLLHGRDPAKDELAAFLLKIGIRPIILAEENIQGRTIIESIEHALVRADYAIALVTGDDEGHLVGRPSEKKLRARQNLIFETGICIGFLGRQRVAILYRSGIELPSDLQGVVYLPFEKISDVKLRIVQELKCSGLDVDANKAFE
jgi:predicted nucleotide-binding protein